MTHLIHAALAFTTALSVLIAGPAMIEKKAQMPAWSASVETSKFSKKLPIYSVDTPEKKVSITFDAAWGADDTDILLEILRKNDVLATFFFCGTWVDKFPEALEKFAAAGHDIANHGDTHAHVAQLNLEQNKKEIQNCHDKIKAVTGLEMNLYRPAYGEYNNTVLDAAEELNYYTIQWDVDSLDWMAKGEQYEIERVLGSKDLKNGSIILFHNDAKFTPKTLDIVIKGLKEKGYEIVPVSQLIYKNNFEIDHTGRQKQISR
ncbi:MAG: polysaccharide deacetylase family protein [Defluviitaleaceae bacterium]|nr:polysaccharide deacetylase family protein [Defluviitaleaceae bacterium]